MSATEHNSPYDPEKTNKNIAGFGNRKPEDLPPRLKHLFAIRQTFLAAWHEGLDRLSPAEQQDVIAETALLMRELAKLHAGDGS